MISVEEEIFVINKRFQAEYHLAKVLEILNNPQNQLPTISVVGTNGKGSTSFYLSKGLLHKYKKVGLFISPAFLYHNERIQINNQPISDEDLKWYINKTQQWAHTYNLTFFEVWTLIAILYFHDQGVEIVVMEAGIGGIKDATHVMHNQVLTLLTSVSFDHTEILGDTIESIIYQKVNIAQPNTTIISSFDNLKYKAIITESLIVPHQLIFAKQIPDQVAYQQSNKGLAQAALDFLQIPIKNIFDLPAPLGRFTVCQLSSNKIILDGAHNLDGIQQLIKSIKNKNMIVVYAAIQERAYQEILQLLTKHFERVWITNFPHFKSWEIKHIDYPYKLDNLAKFLQKNKQDVLVCGSLYFVPLVYQMLIK